MQPDHFRLDPSDSIPNHPNYPVLHYRGVFAPDGSAKSPW